PRNTPTPTSILSGRGSASHIAISASRESLCTGGRSARPLAFVVASVSMSAALARLGVVIHRHAVAERDRLASKNVAGGDFVIGKTVAGRHLDLPAADLRAAGRTDACLAGVRGGQPRGASAVEDIA